MTETTAKQNRAKRRRALSFEKLVQAGLAVIGQRGLCETTVEHITAGTLSFEMLVRGNRGTVLALTAPVRAFAAGVAGTYAPARAAARVNRGEGDA